MFFLTGVARYLFVPLAEAVVFAMLASYVLSRTLVPTMAKYLLQRARAARARTPAAEPQSVRARSSAASSAGSSGCATATAACSSACVAPPRLFAAGVPAGLRARRSRSLPLGRARTSSRRSTAASSSCTCARRPARASRRRRASAIASRTSIRERHPARASSTAILDNIGLPYSGINLSYSNSAPIGAGDADILVALDGGPPADRGLHPRPAAARCRDVSPASTFSFLPADIVSQILNFGLPAPIDVQIVGTQPRGQPRSSRRSC